MINVTPRMVFVLFVISMGFLATACKTPDLEVKKCEASIIAFRINVETENFEAIFRDASPEFRQLVDRTEFTQDLISYKNEIGHPANYQLSSWKYTRLLSGEQLLMLKYVAQHESNTILSEEYVFSLKDGTPHLYNYAFQLRPSISR